MVEIPDALRSVFTATVREQDGTYVVEVPRSEVETGAVGAGETYRVAVLPPVDASPSASSSDAGSSQSAGSSSGSRSTRDAPEPPVDEGEVRDVRIEAVGDQGDGIAKVERGYVVIVPDAKPGDEPTVEIDQVRQNVAFASVVDERAGPGR